jgi:hypothetical protein
MRSFSFFLSGFGVCSPNLKSTEIFTGGISLPAGSDKGCSPLTSTAFFEKKAAQKNFYHRVRFHERCPPSPVGESVNQNRLIVIKKLSKSARSRLTLF